MFFILKSPFGDEIIYYNFIFAFNYKNTNQPPDNKDEFYRVICQTKSAHFLCNGGWVYRAL